MTGSRVEMADGVSSTYVTYAQIYGTSVYFSGLTELRLHDLSNRSCFLCNALSGTLLPGSGVGFVTYQQSRGGQRRDLVLVVLVALSIGMIVGWASLQRHMATRDDTLHNLWAVLHGAPFVTGATIRDDLPFYNRVLFPAIHQGLSHLVPVLSQSQWYLLLRQMSFELAFVAFGLVCLCCLGAPRREVVLSMSLLAVSTFATFGFPWEEPSDALDVLGLALGIGAALRRRFVLCALIAVVFAANRESAAFLGIVWYFLADTPRPRRIVEALGICIASYAATTALRAINPAPGSGSNHFTMFINFKGLLLQVTQHFHPLSWPALLLAVTVALVTSIDYRNERARRFVWCSAILLVPVLLFGLLNELRVYLPSFELLAFAVASSGTSSRKASDL
jgi:hypothetical protein